MIGLQTLIRTCVFEGNMVNGNGSALTISGSSSTVIIMTIFKENEASLGGAVAVKSIQYFYVYGSKFTANSAESSGALMSIEGIAIVIQNCYFNSNIAEEHGGALVVHGHMVKIVRSHYFNNSTLEGDRGAINISRDCLQVVSSDFSSNKARRGGALSIKEYHNNAIFETNNTKRINTGVIAIALAELE